MPIYPKNPPAGLRLNMGHPLSQGLVGCWPLNEQGGTRANDIAGNFINGTLLNGPIWNNIALKFDGSDDNINLGASAKLKPSKISVVAWVKIINTGVINQIFSHDDALTTRIWQFRKDAGETLSFIIFDTLVTNTAATSAKTIGNNLWHQVVGTWDGITVRVYVDGILSGSTAASGSLNQVGTSGAFIGRAETGSPGYFDGLISNVRLYNRALTPNEVMELFVNPYAGLYNIRRRNIVGQAVSALSNFFASF